MDDNQGPPDGGTGSEHADQKKYQINKDSPLTIVIRLQQISGSDKEPKQKETSQGNLMNREKDATRNTGTRLDREPSMPPDETASEQSTDRHKDPIQSLLAIEQEALKESAEHYDQFHSWYKDMSHYKDKTYKSKKNSTNNSDKEDNNTSGNNSIGTFNDDFCATTTQSSPNESSDDDTITNSDFKDEDEQQDDENRHKQDDERQHEQDDEKQHEQNDDEQDEEDEQLDKEEDEQEDDASIDHDATIREIDNFKEEYMVLTARQDRIEDKLNHEARMVEFHKGNIMKLNAERMRVRADKTKIYRNVEHHMARLDRIVPPTPSSKFLQRRIITSLLFFLCFTPTTTARTTMSEGNTRLRGGFAYEIRIPKVFINADHAVAVRKISLTTLKESFDVLTDLQAAHTSICDQITRHTLVPHNRFTKANTPKNATTA